MATLINEQRETDAVNAVPTGGVAPTAYAPLVRPYPVWAAMYECGITRSSLKHQTVVAQGVGLGLF